MTKLTRECAFVGGPWDGDVRVIDYGHLGDQVRATNESSVSDVPAWKPEPFGYYEATEAYDANGRPIMRWHHAR